MSFTDSVCPLCRGTDVHQYHEDSTRRYLQCPHCFLVFVPPQYHLPVDEEKAVYDLHQNKSDQDGYRRFLSRLATPLLQKLGAEKNRGLDFGCGPGPVLARMLEEHGHTVDLYDPIYFNKTDLLTQTYDFVCATEVVEHFRNPAGGFNKLFSLVDSGWLAIMTKRVRNSEAFRNWHYIRDPTHICFYSKETFVYLASLYNVSIEFQGDDIVFLGKNIGG